MKINGFFLLIFGLVLCTKGVHRRHQRNTYSTQYNYPNQASGKNCQLQLECSGEGGSMASRVRLPVRDARGPQGPSGERGLQGPRGIPGNNGLIIEKQPRPTAKVAFFAGINNNVITPPGKDAKVLFDNAVTNVGDAYNASSGVFTAPVSGVYNFFIAISAQGMLKAAVRLFHNNTQVLDIWCESAPWSTASNQAVLKLSTNDEVYLQFRENVYNIHGYMYSTFSGFLLYEL